MIELLDRHRDLVVAAETGAARYRSRSLRGSGARTSTRCWPTPAVDDPDDVLADLLLAPLAVDLHPHLVARGASAAARTAALTQLAHAVLPTRS